MADKKCVPRSNNKPKKKSGKNSKLEHEAFMYGLIYGLMQNKNSKVSKSYNAGFDKAKELKDKQKTLL